MHICMHAGDPSPLAVALLVRRPTDACCVGWVASLPLCEGISSVPPTTCMCDDVSSARSPTRPNGHVEGVRPGFSEFCSPPQSTLVVVLLHLMQETRTKNVACLSSLFVPAGCVADGVDRSSPCVLFYVSQCQQDGSCAVASRIKPSS
jgi:hypothetical protein